MGHSVGLSDIRQREEARRGNNIYIFFTLVSQDTKTTVQEESAAAEILAPVLKAPTETPAPSPAEAGISLGTSQGSSLTFLLDVLLV